MKDYDFHEDSNEKSNKKVYHRSDFGASFTPFAFVTINGEEIARKYAVDVKIDQALCEHTVFELLIPGEAFGDTGTYPARNSKKLLGAKVVIELKQFGKTAFACSGEVVQISFQVKNKYPYVKLTGKSPTWKLDSGKQCRSFENQTLEQIVKTVTEPYTRNGLPIKIAPRTKESFEYIVMSNESDFEFLRRLAIRFGEYFFWNGTLLVFGRAGINEVKLQEGRDFHEYDLDMQAKPQHFAYQSYDYKEVKTHEIDSRNASDGKPFNPSNPFQRRTVSDSENLFPEAPVSYTSDFPGEGESALTNAVLRQKELRRNTARLTAKTDNPRLRLGSVAKAEAWVREYLGFKNEHVAIEDYIVTQITHSYNSQGYYNTFTAVPFEQEVAPNMDESFFPRCRQQSARVTDNNDPEEMSRIRVRFAWQKPEEQTPWLRIVTPYAGEGKGIHVIPEIEEEVVVDFEGGNAEKPVVLGALFNGKGKSGHGGEGNYTKAFQTKNTLRLIDDAEGSIMEKDQVGSFWKLEGDGKLRLKAKQIVLEAEDITVNVGKNMILNVSGRLSVLASHLRQTVSKAIKMFSAEALILSKKKLNLQTKELSAAGTDKVFIHSDKETVLNSKGTSFVKGKIYKLGNKADSYKKEKEEEETASATGTEKTANPDKKAGLSSKKIVYAKGRQRRLKDNSHKKDDTKISSLAVVEFRTMQDGSYNGEFGFDWLRKYDLDSSEQRLTDEPAYRDIIEESYDHQIPVYAALQAAVDAAAAAAAAAYDAYSAAYDAYSAACDAYNVACDAYKAAYDVYKAAYNNKNNVTTAALNTAKKVAMGAKTAKDEADKAADEADKAAEEADKAAEEADKAAKEAETAKDEAEKAAEEANDTSFKTAANKVAAKAKEVGEEAAKAGKAATTVSKVIDDEAAKAGKAATTAATDAAKAAADLNTEITKFTDLSTAKTTAKEEAYEDLKDKYECIYIDDTDHAFHVPYLTLFSQEYVIEEHIGTLYLWDEPPENIPEYEATLRVLVNIEKEIDRLEFECGKEGLFEITKWEKLKDTKKTNGIEEAGTVTITCLKDFSDEKEIKIYAYPKDSEGKESEEQEKLKKLAGKIKVLPNDKDHRKKQKIVLVKVKTKIDETRGFKTGDFSPSEKQMLRNFLYQSLIISEFEDGSLLDLSNDSEFQIKDTLTGGKTYGQYIYTNTKNDLKKTDGNINQDKSEENGKKGIYDYVKELYINQNGDKYKYDDFFIFCFDENTYDSYVNKDSKGAVPGQVQKIGMKNVFLFNGIQGAARSNDTMAHEALHGLGLHHTHKDGIFITDSNQKYVYPNGNEDLKNSTDNIMSYGQKIRKTTWHWQWEIVNEKLKK